MRRVCVEAGAAIGARPHFRIGFNLSARHFADEAIVEDVRDDLRRLADRARARCCSKSPSARRWTISTMARRVIASLQGLGVHVGIDDLGTGHSGLSYMLKLGVDFIKIDKMFVDAIDTERYSTTIIETLVGLARDMRMEIIAEGVETFEQVQHLRDARHPQGAGLCVRAAVAGLLVPATARGRRSRADDATQPCHRQMRWPTRWPHEQSAESMAVGPDLFASGIAVISP